MGFDVMGMGVSIGKGLIFSFRTCYKSVRDHPFYWGLVFFFIFLYRFFPSLFGLLVSFSPVLVCTAALLGTLLSSGNPHIPEIEKDDQRTHEIASLKAAVVENDLVFQRDESLSAEAHVEKRGEVEEKVAEEPMDLDVGIEANISKVDKDVAFSTINDNNLMGKTVKIEEDPKEIPGEVQMIEEEREFHKAELVEKQEFDEEDLLIGGAPGARKDIDGTSSIKLEENETPRRKIDMPGGVFSITQDLSWKHVEGHAESCDSDSDRSESSSPDASMADIMPMLYELHPLLESEPSQPPLISLRNSTAVLESSNRSHDDGSAGSEEEGENQEEEEEEEEAQGTQGDETKGVVTWTEDDQKNLMDLGTLELERNQRLESLIAKRRAKKLMRMEAEKNLIDLDSNDPPFSIAPISTKRNPFDLPYDSYEAMDLPPIPGSAPSVMLPRRNPFDIPYEPYEEKPNLTENSSQQEFIPFQPKDFQFRRHESFSVGVSVEPKQRRHFSPYFVTERMASEGVEYTMFQRQYSEKSDSKVSSVPETESASSAADQEDHSTLAEQELPQEGDPISHMDHASDHVECGSQSSEVDLVEIDPEEKKAVKVDDIDIKRVNEEQRMMHVDCTSNHVECDSQSSGELDSAEVYPEERRDFDVDGVNMNVVDEETVHEVELQPHQSGYVGSLVEADKSEVHAVDEKCTDSSSSSSEVHEKLFHMETDEGSRDQELKRDDNTEGSNDSNRSSLTESDFNLRNRIMESGDESQTKEPVYDSSPSGIEKTLSNMTSIQEALFYVDKGVVTSTPSIASDLQVDVSEVGSPPVLVHGEDGESVAYGGRSIEISPGNERIWMASSNLCAIDENESRSMPVTEISDHDVIEVGFSGISQNPDDPRVPKAVVGEVSSGSGSSSLETRLGEESRISEDVHFQLKQNQVSFSSSDEDFQQHDANLKVDTLDSSYSNAVSSEDSKSSELEKPISLMEKLTVHPSSDGDHEETQDSSALLVKSIEEGNVQTPEDEDSSSLSMLTVPVPVLPEVFEIKSTTAPTDIKENVLVSIQSGEESPIFENQSDSVKAKGSHVTKEEFSEEAEGIKEIDEAILSELDTVGDFSVKELGLSMDQKEKNLSLEEQESLPELQVLGDRPVEDIEVDSDKLSKLEAVADSPNEYKTRSANVGVKVEVLEVTESTSESQVLEASSLDDANVDFKHIPERVVEKSVVVDLVQSEPLPKETEVEFTEFELTNQDSSEKTIGSELPVVEARSLEDIESAFKELNQGVQETTVTESFYDKPMTVETEIGPTDSGPSESVLDLTATISKLPVLEASLIEDIDMQSNKIHGVQSTISTESFHDKLTGENSEAGLADARPSSGDSSSTVTDSELPVLEAKSVEDIDLALKQLQEGVQNPSTAESFHDEPTGEKIEVGLADSGLSERNTDLISAGSELPVLEASSLEDIDLAFKQLHGGVQAIDSLHDKPTREETEVGVSESGQSDGEATKISSELPVLEAKSVEDIDLAFKQLQGGDLEGTILPKSVDRPPVVESQDVVETHLHLPVDDAKSSEGLEVEVKEMGKVERESYFEESGMPQENSIIAEEASPGDKGTSECPSSSTSAVRHKKAGSHKSSSSSSSSSGSSSSDSE
ncbi:uncharacterized protein LOC122638297 isoform X2 [Telopea speciosissima]|uniref:uncharacterized protein LOC122638297 isoform X2 n=1 Tax=Telopea speciosissima TaxID=54955 RepID=UPI001CC459B9|nr:uncharacterized protein LOC122638297 isoform X2 [Telopea speciosissima]